MNSKTVINTPAERVMLNHLGVTLKPINPSLIPSYSLSSSQLTLSESSYQLKLKQQKQLKDKRDVKTKAVKVSLNSMLMCDYSQQKASIQDRI